MIENYRMLNREERKALRRHGESMRVTDVADVVIEAIPMGFQPKKTIFERANDDIVKKHSELTRLRRQKHTQERHQSRLAMSRRKSANNRARAMVGAIGVKVKYKRIPKNRAKLIGLDIISQLIVDYFKSNELATVIGKKLVENSKSKDKSLVRNQTKALFKDYIQRISSYFTSLIDLKLSNQLLMSDLQKVNREKDSVRSEVFSLREQRNQLGVQLKELREEFAQMRRDHEHKVNLIRRFESIKEGSLLDRVNWKLNKLNNGVMISLNDDKDRSQMLLEKLRDINDKLERSVGRL